MSDNSDTWWIALAPTSKTRSSDYLYKVTAGKTLRLGSRGKNLTFLGYLRLVTLFGSEDLAMKSLVAGADALQEMRTRNASKLEGFRREAEQRGFSNPAHRRTLDRIAFAPIRFFHPESRRLFYGYSVSKEEFFRVLGRFPQPSWWLTATWYNVDQTVALSPKPFVPEELEAVFKTRLWYIDNEDTPLATTNQGHSVTHDKTADPRDQSYVPSNDSSSSGTSSTALSDSSLVPLQVSPGIRTAQETSTALMNLKRESPEQHAEIENANGGQRSHNRIVVNPVTTQVPDLVINGNEDATGRFVDDSFTTASLSRQIIARADGIFDGAQAGNTKVNNRVAALMGLDSTALARKRSFDSYALSSPEPDHPGLYRLAREVAAGSDIPKVYTSTTTLNTVEFDCIVVGDRLIVTPSRMTRGIHRAISWIQNHTGDMAWVAHAPLKVLVRILALRFPLVSYTKNDVITIPNMHVNRVQDRCVEVGSQVDDARRAFAGCLSLLVANGIHYKFPISSKDAMAAGERLTDAEIRKLLGEAEDKVQRHMSPVEELV